MSLTPFQCFISQCKLNLLFEQQLVLCMHKEAQFYVSFVCICAEVHLLLKGTVTVAAKHDVLLPIFFLSYPWVGRVSISVQKFAFNHRVTGAFNWIK